MQLMRIYLYDKIQANRYYARLCVKTTRIEVTESEARGGKDVIPVVPSFLGEVHLRWRGVDATQANPMPQKLTLFSGEL